MAFPWRAVWLPAADEGVDFARVLIMVPKRRLRHAVDRVTMRRRMREAFRLSREEIVVPGRGIDVALVYVADKLTTFDEARRSIRKIFKRINATLDEELQPS